MRLVSVDSCPPLPLLQLLQLAASGAGLFSLTGGMFLRWSLLSAPFLSLLSLTADGILSEKGTISVWARGRAKGRTEASKVAHITSYFVRE